MKWPLCITRCVFSQTIEDLPGIIVLEVKDEDFFKDEGGGHRWQRIPPNEKRGRVHTSTVTVAVIPDAPIDFSLDTRDVKIEAFRAGGKGGQHRNKTETAVRVVHVPTGTTVVAASKSQKQNKKQALKTLRARLYQAEENKNTDLANKSRRKQVGKGARGDKIRTYRERDDRAVDHRTGRKTSLSKLKKGDWSGLKSTP